jgi:hypothetical protein
MFPEDYPPLLTESEPEPEPGTEMEAEAAGPAFARFSRFAALCEKRRQLKEELEEIEKQMDRLQAPLRSFFMANPQFEEGLRISGVTIFVKREIWVRPKMTSSRQGVCDALRTGGLGHYVHDDFSTSGLSKHVRELEKQHARELQSGALADVAALLPPAVAETLNITPKYSVQGRRSIERKD